MLHTSNIRTKDIMVSLPLVASILGDRYGVTVNIGGKHAYTNGKNINLPTLPLNCDAELLALARGFVDHEAAHIRHTDFAALQAVQLTPMQKHIWNTLEDHMVEQKLAALFPGCRQHFRWLIQHHFGKDNSKAGDDPAKTVLPSLSVLNWLLLSIRAWEVPDIATQRDAEAVAIHTAYPGLLEELEAILVRAKNHCQSTEDCISHALELSAVIENYARNPPDSQESQGSTTEPLASSEEDDSTTDSHTQTEDASTIQEQNTQERDLKALISLLDAEAQDLPLSLGEQLAETLSARQAPDTHWGLRVAQVGHKHMMALPADIQAATLASSVALRTRLHGLLQAKAQQPCIPGRRGKLDPQRLHAVSVNSPHVFLKRGKKTRVATAVHVLLDCSGSMFGTQMELAGRACYAVAVALERCQGVNVGVTVFPAFTGAAPDTITVAPLVQHGARVHGNFNMYAQGYTPLAEALWWVMQQMHPLREQRKIILIVSDGQPDSVPAVQHALKQASGLGFEVMGLGIEDNCLEQLLPEASRTIHQMQDLAPAMFGMLQKALLGKGNRP